jgi:hypothetical protein
MTRGMRTLLTLTSAVTLTATVGVTSARGTEEEGRPTWCGEVSHSGATWHRFWSSPASVEWSRLGVSRGRRMSARSASGTGRGT